METRLQGVYLDVPQSDLKFLREFAGKMGWKIETRESLLENYIISRPQKPPRLTEEEIMAEVKSVRYEK